MAREREKKKQLLKYFKLPETNSHKSSNPKFNLTMRMGE